MKHMRFAFCPLDGHVYGHGGDFTVLGDNLGISTNSGRGETWRFNPRGSLARWERVMPFWGKAGDPMTTGSDERLIFWDGQIGKFWIWPTARFIGAVPQSGDPRWVGIPEPHSDFPPMLLFNPITQRIERAPWSEDRTGLAEPGQISGKSAFIDERRREIHLLRLEGSGANTVTILNLATGAWRNLNTTHDGAVRGYWQASIQREWAVFDPASGYAYAFDQTRRSLARYDPAKRDITEVMSASDLSLIPAGYMENEDSLLWNNDTGMIEYYRADRTSTYPHRLYVIDAIRKRVWDGGDRWPDGSRRSAREWVYAPGSGSIGCGQAFAAGRGNQNQAVGIGLINEHWQRWIKQRNVAAHQRVVPAGVGQPEAADKSSPITSALIPFRAWGSPALDEATGDVYLFGSMHGDYMGNDIDVVNVANASNRQLPHTPPPERSRQPHAGDGAYGGGGSAQAWFEGTGYAAYPAQGSPTSHWWMPYSIHPYGRSSYHPGLGFIVFATGVRQWNDPAPPTQQFGLLAYKKEGPSIDGGRAQRWTFVKDVDAAAANWSMSNYAPDLGVVLAFESPGSMDRTNVYEIRADGSVTLVRSVSGSWHTSPSGSGGGLHRYLGNRKFLNVAWANNRLRTSVYDHASGVFDQGRTSENAPAEWAYFKIPNGYDNLLAAVDRATQTIYWAQYVSTNSIKVWSAPVSDPYVLTEIKPRPLGEMTALALPEDALASAAAGRGQLFFHGDSLWLFTKSRASAPGNDDGSYQFWRMVVSV